MRVSATLFVAAALAAVVFAVDNAEEPVVKVEEPFVAPKPEGKYEFFESFSDNSWKKNWFVVESAPYTGEWEVSTGSLDKGIAGDAGLVMKTPGARHAIVTAFDKTVTNKDDTLVVQYELRAENKFGCDGGYIKLLSKQEGEFKASEFKDGTPYTIMFGPDKCGGTDKVHFILRHKHPKTGAFEEKHLKDSPRVPADKLTHVYTLIVRPDNSFEILIDGASKSKGNLLESMNPPVNPAKEIDDPNDKKPSDWVDDEFIVDPEDSKPEDWDEDAPAMIPDASANKPEGWSDDAPLTIADPEAKQPSDWDEEEDGEWEAPQVPNPICDAVGCGEWKRPTIKNPAFKGKWSARKIKNPDWVGIWAPKKIANPDYVEDLHPSNVFPIAGLGIELLTNAGGLVFDNILITHDESVASKLRAQTWEKRSEKEKTEYKAEAKETKEPDFMTKAMDTFADYPIPICIGIITLAMLIFLIIWRFCLTEDDEPSRTPVPKAKSEDKKKSEGAAAAAADASDKAEVVTSGDASPATGKGKATKRAGKSNKE